MDKKVEGVLYQIAKKLNKEEGWMVDKDFAVTVQSDGHIILIRSFMVRGSLDEDEWKDQIAVTIHLSLGTDDQWTYWPEFVIYAQIKIGDIADENITYKMQSNVAFLPSKDVEDEAKAAKAAREITRLVESHVGETYQDYVEKNEEVIRFYKQGNSGTA
jgi:hypothetical protein